MSVKTPTRERITEVQEVWVSDDALTFDEYLAEYEGYREHIELVRGVPKTRMAARLEHEKLFAWVFVLLSNFVEKHDLGVVLGSRTAVRISDYDGRLPDILFVRKDRTDILESLKLREAPDSVIEIISPASRRSEKMELEADYRSIGIPEIIFLDTRKVRAQVYRSNASGYQFEELTEGVLYFKTIPGFWLKIDWLTEEARPPVNKALEAIEAAK